ncbi:helix-turn-helix domain-containing protein [Cohnella panacarvi]|uniref:helix-turn-helix domain-containing protein n=1 Tax=Cohnella panacarvi TaxID=400776 RepID=UPI000A0047E9
MMTRQVNAEKLTLRAARKSSGYSAASVANYLKVSVGSLYRYERNADNLRISTATKMLSLYNVPAKKIRFSNNFDMP